MQKNNLRAYVVLLVGILLFNCNTGKAQELLFNDFENPTTYNKLYHLDTIEEWELIFWDNQGYGYGRVDNEVAYSGKNSLKLVCDSANFQSAVRLSLKNPISFNQGDTMVFSFYSKAEAENFQLVNRFKNGTQIDSTVLLTPNFKKYTFTHIFASTASNFDIWIMLGLDRGTIWLDDISLKVKSVNHTDPDPNTDDTISVYHISPKGNDNYTGSLSQPMKSINKALSVISPGETCLIHGGNYRETLNITRSGTDTNPITIKAFNNEKVLIDGRDPLNGLIWQQREDGTWAAEVNDDDLQQGLLSNECIVFSNDHPFIEARWPNMKFHENWIEDKKWALMSTTSVYGTVKSSDFAALGFSLAGGVIHMKYVENFYGSCNITSHAAGSANINYEKTSGWGDWSNSDFNRGKGSWDYRFYVSGILELLDAEEEWFYDESNNTLYVKTHGNVNPDTLNLSIKIRDFGIYTESVDNITLEDIQLFGTSIKMGLEKEKHCRNLIIRNCKILYPNQNRFLKITDDPSDTRRKNYFLSDAYPFIDAESALIENCEIGWASNSGLFLNGRNNVVRNCVIHNTALSGYMARSGMHLGYGYGQSYASTSANSLENSTVYNSGGVGLYHIGPGPAKIHNNHFFNAGIYTGDISCTYLPYGAKAGGTELSYNWIHGMDNGKGMRCDTKGNYITVHHNLVWDTEQGCKWQGDGPYFLYNNTYFANNNLNPFKLTGESYAYQEILDSYDVMNNISFRLYINNPSPAYDFKYHENNHFTANYKLVDPVNEFVSTESESIDLRPAAGSPLIDAGSAVSGITDDAIGETDIGAYEYGGDYWYPGADWLNDSIPIPITMAAATRLSKSVRVSPQYPQEYINTLLRKATCIAPYRGSVDVPIESQLFFKHGYEATSSNIYFGTDSVGVANATNASSEFLVNQSYTEHKVDLNDFDKGLQAETTYYWRVDAVDENGLVTIGDVWYFTTKMQLGTFVPGVEMQFDFQVFPNPSSEKILIRFHSNENLNSGKIQIINILGKTCLSHNFASYPIEIDVSGLFDGLYILKVIGTEQDLTTRIIVKH